MASWSRRYPGSDQGDAERAIAAARKAFDNGPWPRMTAAERPASSSRPPTSSSASDELAYARPLESGKPITQAPARSAVPPISGAMPPRSPATCTARATTRSGDGNARRRAARADRRRLDHHAMEFPVPDRQPEAALRAGRRLHDGRQADRTDVRHRRCFLARLLAEAGLRPASSISSPALARRSARR